MAVVRREDLGWIFGAIAVIFTVVMIIAGILSTGIFDSKSTKYNYSPSKNKDIFFDTLSVKDMSFSKGKRKQEFNNHIGAISDFTKAIEFDPNYAKAYSKRGISKESLGDLTGACADWKKAAELGDTDAAKWVANQCN